MIGVHQNAFTTTLEEYKTRLLNEIQKMSIDLGSVVEKRTDLGEEQKKNITNEEVKQLNTNQ